MWLGRRVMMAADLDRDALWHGGFYELAIRLGRGDDPRLAAAVEALWAAARVTGRFLRAEGGGHRATTSATRDVLAGRDVHGWVALPDGRDVACSTVTVRIDGGEDWLDFCLPLGGLEESDERVGAFPFDDGGGHSQRWREPLDAWLASLAAEVFRVVSFEYAVIGFEVSGDELEDPHGDRFVGSVVPDTVGETSYRPVTRWDVARFT